MKTKNLKKSSVDLSHFAYVFTATISIFVLFVTAATIPFIKDFNQGAMASYHRSANGLLIAKIAPHAFGLLSNAISSPNAEAVSSQKASSVVGLGGGGSLTKISADTILPPNYGNFLKYAYTGEKFSQDEASLPVYKKNLDSLDNNFSTVVAAVKQSDFNFFNLEKFINVKVDNLSFKEDRDFGYYFSLSPNASNFYISKNWEKWSNSSAGCMDDACWQANRVKISEIPSDEELINIANSFVDEYSISLLGLGEPSVQNSWRISYENSPDKDGYYLPEEVYVVYPIVINGLETYDQSGNKYGLMVGVDIRQRKVANVNGSSGLSFESSDYETLTSVEDIIKTAEEGGNNGRWYFNPESDSTETLSAELGTPKKILMQRWMYENSTGKNYEIFIPAYLFPVTSRPDGLNYFYAENIVVPLAKEFYDENTNRPEPYLLKSEGAESPAIETTPLLK